MILTFTKTNLNLALEQTDAVQHRILTFALEGIQRV